MYDPDPLEDDVAEWIEVKNVSMATIDLSNCVVEDRAAQSDTSVPAAELGEGTLEPRAFILLARTDDPMLNGGLSPDVILSLVCRMVAMNWCSPVERLKLMLLNMMTG